MSDLVLWSMAFIAPLIIVAIVMFVDSFYYTIQLFPCELENEDGELVKIPRAAIVVEMNKIQEARYMGVLVLDIMSANPDKYEVDNGTIV